MDKKRRWGRWLLGAIGLVVVLIAAAPTLLSTPAGTDFVLGRTFGGVHGQVTAGDLRLGWFSGVAVDNFEIRSSDDRPAFRVAGFHLDKPLWQLALDQSDLGTVRLEHPKVNVIASEQGTNFTTLFPPAPAQPNAPAQPEAPASGGAAPRCRLEIVDGSLSWLPQRAEREWGIDKLNLALSLRPGPPGDPRTEMFVDRVVMLDHSRLTPGMCDDIFKYIAPVLSDTTTVNGELSLIIEQGKWPLGDFKHGELSGLLSLHAVTVGPSPLVQQIADVLRIPNTTIQLARESHINFAMADGRVRHEGLEFGIGDVLKVKSSGTVAIDSQALDMSAEVRVQVPTAAGHNQPFLKALNEQVIRLPIRGTLQQPQIDASGLPAVGLTLLQAALSKLSAGQPLGTAEDLLTTLREQGILPNPVPNPAANGQGAVDVPGARVQILGGILERNRQRMQPPANPSQPVPNQPAPPKRPLGRLLDSLLPKPEEKPPANSPSPSGRGRG